MKKDFDSVSICVVGLGYVGLPLAIEFSKLYKTIGLDLDESRVEELRSGYDRTGEVSADRLSISKNISYTNCLEDIKKCNIFILALPTPVDEYCVPDLKIIKLACEDIGSILKKGDLVILESTVYPGVTREILVPILERKSGLLLNIDFSVGYSPERINPGDSQRDLTSIVKITSGSDENALRKTDALYSTIISAGTCAVESIEIAEAAKVIENAQRDVNVAFMNELQVIFDSLNLPTSKVLEAAKTKWNFLDFKPGLVGGHCIGVDPYYLIHKAKKLGVHPELISSARRINDNMSSYFANKILEKMIDADMHTLNAKVLVLGCTFKENCPDTRNSKVFDLLDILQRMGLTIDIYDPVVQPEDTPEKHRGRLLTEPKFHVYDAVIQCVAHDCFANFREQYWSEVSHERTIAYDIKGTWN